MDFVILFILSVSVQLLGGWVLTGATSLLESFNILTVLRKLGRYSSEAPNILGRALDCSVCAGFWPGFAVLLAVWIQDLAGGLDTAAALVAGAAAHLVYVERFLRSTSSALDELVSE